MKKLPLKLVTGIFVSAFLIGSNADASSIVADNLITNSNLTTPWLGCGDDSLAIDVSELGEGGCAYRTTPVDAGITYNLTCGITVVKYASMTLAFLDADDNQLATETTEAFEHVFGAYSVELAAPAGTTKAAIGIYGEIGSGFQDCTLVDATPPELPTKGSIAGTSWFDESRDSIFDGSENIITGTPVTLAFNDSDLAHTKTDADGNYYFGDLDVGVCYTVTFDNPDSTVELGAIGGDNDANANGTTEKICLSELEADAIDVDAGFVAVAPPEPPADLAICGHTWLDANEDGRANAGDTMLSDLSVRLFDGQSNQLATVSSDTSGKFAINDLSAGEYQLQFITPDGYEPTTNFGSATAGRSYIDANGLTPVFSLPADGNTAVDSACTIEQVNGGFVKLPVALDPTVALDDKAEQEVGTSFSIDILSNDNACDGVQKVNLLGHNVPGKVTYNTETQKLEISDTTADGSYSIKYGLRGVCGSYDTATVIVKLNQPVVIPPAAPDAPMCRVETRGDVFWGGVDVFSTTENGFTPQYNMYDRNKGLVITLNSDDVTHKKVIGNDVNHWSQPWIGNWEIEWNGANYGYDQVSIYYVSAVENGVESSLTECVRSLISPIALDLENQGRIQQIAGDYEVDLYDDGNKVALSHWFAPSAGILINKNAAGKVSGKHLFGNLPGVYEDGFEKLQTLDSNNDRQITGSELSSLAIWTDLNSDTIIDISEVSSLADHEIVSLAVDHYKFMARAEKSNGKSILMEDVWLPRAPMASLVKQ